MMNNLRLFYMFFRYPRNFRFHPWYRNRWCSKKGTYFRTCLPPSPIGPTCDYFACSCGTIRENKGQLPEYLYLKKKNWWYLIDGKKLREDIKNGEGLHRVDWGKDKGIYSEGE